MTTAVMYNSDGMIMQVRSGNSGGVLADAQASGHSYLLVESDIDLDRFYVNTDTSEVVEYPEKPSDAHVFNFASRAWELDLGEARDMAWSRIKRSRNADEFSTFEWNSHTFQCDERSQSRIMSAVQRAQLDSTLTMVWTLSDNSTVTLNATELKQVGQALASHIDACHVKARGLRTQINAAETEAELDLITW
jgi:hypothetical protein